jgi:hypothetical protein
VLENTETESKKSTKRSKVLKIANISAHKKQMEDLKKL